MSTAQTITKQQVVERLRAYADTKRSRCAVVHDHVRGDVFCIGVPAATFLRWVRLVCTAILGLVSVMFLVSGLVASPVDMFSIGFGLFMIAVVIVFALVHRSIGKWRMVIDLNDGEIYKKKLGGKRVTNASEVIRLKLTEHYQRGQLIDVSSSLVVKRDGSSKEIRFLSLGNWARAEAFSDAMHAVFVYFHAPAANASMR